MPKTNYARYATPNTDVGSTLRNLRRDRYFSQEYIASCLGISQEMYSRLERGKARMTLEYFCTLFDVFQIKPQEFL